MKTKQTTPSLGNHRLRSAILLCGPLSMLGCSPATEHEQPSGRLTLQLIDAPADVEHVYITPVELSIRPCEGGGWLDFPVDVGQVDLLTLVGGASLALLDQVDVESGEFCELRLRTASPPVLELEDGDSYELKIPSSDSSGIKFKGDFLVQPGFLTLLTVDFDLDKSLHENGNGRYTMQPVIEIVDEVQVPEGASYTTAYPDAPADLTFGSGSLHVPAGAVGQPTSIWCQELGAGAFECGPDGTQFAREVILAITNPDIGEDLDAVFIDHDGERVPTITSTTTQTAYGSLMHFSPMLLTIWKDYYANAMEDVELSTDISPSLGATSLPTVFSLQQGEYQRFNFSKLPGYRYVFCAEATDGAVDIYSSWIPGVSQQLNGQTIWGGGTILGDRFVAESPGGTECIAITATAPGPMWVAVRAQSAATFRVHVTTASLLSPDNFTGQLTWPMAECGQVTYEKFGPFNSPWGNSCAEHDPFYVGASRHFHSGVDIYCDVDQPVRAACSGKVKRGDFDKDNKAGWQFYVAQECDKIDNQVYSIVYGHIIPDPNLPETLGGHIEAGTQIGTIAPLEQSKDNSAAANSELRGEQSHLHYAICKGTYGDCQPQAVTNIDRFEALVGGSAVSELINPDCFFNGDLYDPNSLPDVCMNGDLAAGIAVHPPVCEALKQF